MDGAVEGEEADLGASVARQPEAQNNAQSESTSFEMSSCELRNSRITNQVTDVIRSTGGELK